MSVKNYTCNTECTFATSAGSKPQHFVVGQPMRTARKDVPEHFDEDPEIEAPVDTDGDGKTTKDELRQWLIGKGVTPPSRATKDELQAMVDEVNANSGDDDFVGE